MSENPLTPETPATRNSAWLMDMPCVQDGRVIIDVRGTYPTAIVKQNARVIRTLNDMIWFVVDTL